MKRRVTVYLDDVPRQILKTLAAEDDKLLGDVVAEFLYGERKTTVSAEEIERLEKKYASDEEEAEEHPVTSDVCQLHLLSQEAKCDKESTHAFQIPEDMQKYTDHEIIALCEEHYNQASL